MLTAAVVAAVMAGELKKAQMTEVVVVAPMAGVVVVAPFDPIAIVNVTIVIVDVMDAVLVVIVCWNCHCR